MKGSERDNTVLTSMLLAGGVVLSPYLLAPYLLVLEDSHDVGATGGGGTGEDKADGIGHDFQDDDPPGVVGFHASLLRLLRVGQDGFDLLFAEFDFHNVFGFRFGYR